MYLLKLNNLLKNWTARGPARYFPAAQRMTWPEVAHKVIGPSRSGPKSPRAGPKTNTYFNLISTLNVNFKALDIS